MPSIEQMHPSFITVRVGCIPEPPVPRKNRRPKAHCGKTRFGSVSNWRNFIATTNVLQCDASGS
ncbi:hypothetical protein Hanom_Chr17g01572751 [Helianthus anomalus]